MLPELIMQSAGGGAFSTACNRKVVRSSMKRLTAFDLVRAVKNVRHSSLILCDRYVQGCIKQSPGRLHESLDVDKGPDVRACWWRIDVGTSADDLLTPIRGSS